MRLNSAKSLIWSLFEGGEDFWNIFLCVGRGGGGGGIVFLLCFLGSVCFNIGFVGSDAVPPSSSEAIADVQEAFCHKH